MTKDAASTPPQPEKPALAAVFAIALACRLTFLLLADQPLLYTHQYTYFTSALRIASHPSPLSYVLASDEWRVWDGYWTIAPLYFLMAAAVFKLFGAHLFALQLVQCLLDSIVAVCVALLGRETAGRRGALAGIAYALYFPAIELCAWTMTENAHTVLFAVGLVLLARESQAPSARGRVLAGVVLGLSALARSVSSAYLGLATLWRAWRMGVKQSASAFLILAGGLAVILPWTARNVFVIGDKVLIEDAAFENIWWANNLVDRNEYLAQEKVVHSQPTPDAKRMAALRFAISGVRNHPERVPDKIATAFWHFLRPEGLQNLLRVERSLEPWRHVVTLLLDDLPMILCVPLFVVFLIAGRPSAAREYIVIWTLYYLAMVTIVFHNEVRYRSALMPFAFAGAAGGLAVLRDPVLFRRVRTLLAALLGLFLVYRMVAPYAAPAQRAIASAWARRGLSDAVARGDLAAAERLANASVQADLRSPRPWIAYGRALVWRDHPAEALFAYQRAAEVASPANWSPRIALPPLFAAAGEQKEATRRLNTLDKLSWSTDPWLILEIAWRELPPPRSDEIRLAQGDYGAVRGFFHPRGLDPSIAEPHLGWNKYERLGTVLPPPGAHRWSRARSWLRLRPTVEAAAYDVTIGMGAPFPSTLVSPQVVVSAEGMAPSTFTLTNEVRPYSLRVPKRAGAPLVIELRAPTWCLAGEPAEQGVRVDRMSVSPAR